MGAFSDNKKNCPVCEHVNERPLTESEPHAAALQENQALQATFQSAYCFRADQGDGPLLLDEEHGLLRIGEDGWVLGGGRPCAPSASPRTARRCLKTASVS